MSFKVKYILVPALLALCAGVFVAQITNNKPLVKPIVYQGTVLEKPRSIKPFSLMGIDHKIFDQTKLHGQWTMVFFGFTSCTSICPVTLAELSKMSRLLRSQGVSQQPRVVMISLDPKRDNLERLSAYVTAFDSQFYAARGNEQTLQAMTKELGVAYMTLAPKQNQSDYVIDHSGTVMLFNPQGQLVEFFTAPLQAAALVHDFVAYSERSVFN